MSDISLMYFRREYLSSELLEQDLLEDPYLQFNVWLEDALRSGIDDPTAMSLATADLSGKPSLRVVLLKEARPDGYVFLSNYESRKGNELKLNPYAAALFFWPGLERQLRIEGVVSRLTEHESDVFFALRPIDSRIAAIISDQSRVIPDRQYLDERFKALQTTMVNETIKRPENWGGYMLNPTSYEFWQGRENRLNDRIRYDLKEGEWHTFRLAP